MLDYSCPTCDFEGRDLEVFSRCRHAADVTSFEDFLASRCLGPSRLEGLRLINVGILLHFLRPIMLFFFAFLHHTSNLDFRMNSGLLTSLCVSFLTNVITSSHFIVALLKVRIPSSLFVSTDLFKNFCARHYAGVGIQPCSGVGAH